MAVFPLGAEARERPVILVFDVLDDRLFQALEEAASGTKRQVLALATRREVLAGHLAWRVLAAGASDLIAWDEVGRCGADLAARLERYAEVDALLQLPLVRENLVGSSPAWRAALRQVTEVARFTDSAILLTGETGTGKELVARVIHTLDRRPDKGQLVTLDCTTVVPELAGSEFFGHERGAFTSAISARDGAFALADKGTLFLDEVGELPPMLQADLLRAVQEKSYKRIGSNTWRQADFRLLCATHRDLRRQAADGSFRADLYHRLAAWTCRLPPLRERREDILPLARHFAAQARAGVAEEDTPPFDPAVQDLLLARDYAGNVRELRQFVTRMAKRHVGPGPITVGDIPEDDRAEMTQTLRREWMGDDFETVLRRALASGAGLQEIKDRTAEIAIRIAIADAEGSLQRAALRLGVTDRALQLRRATVKPNRAGHGQGTGIGTGDQGSLNP